MREVDGKKSITIAIRSMVLGLAATMMTGLTQIDSKMNPKKKANLVLLVF